MELNKKKQHQGRGDQGILGHSSRYTKQCRLGTWGECRLETGPKVEHILMHSFFLCVVRNAVKKVIEGESGGLLGFFAVSINNMYD